MTSTQTGHREALSAASAHPARLHNLFLMTESFATGGSERQFSALARNLDRHAFHILLGCMRRDGAFFEGLGDVAAFPLGKSLYKPSSWRARARLARHLQHENIEIAQAFDFYTNLTLIPAAYWARTPVIIAGQRQLGDLLTPAQFKIQLLAFRLADAVVCNSKAAAGRLHAAGLSRAKLVVIPNGMPPEVFAPIEPAYPRSGGAFRVGMVARMNSPSKNHNGLLRSVALLRKQIPQVELLLAGDGPLRSELEQQARGLGLSEAVRFLGDRRDIPAIMASLDVSVLPSLSESLSNSIIESMAQAVPVVAAHVGGNEELLADGRGVLVPVNNDQALADALTRLLEDSALRQTMGCAAQTFARENFTIEQTCQRHADLYLRLLEQKR